MVESSKIFFAFGDELRIIAAVSVTRWGEIHLVSAEDYRLFASAIAVITAVFAFGIMLAVAEMIIHLDIKGTLNDPLFEVGKYA